MYYGGFTYSEAKYLPINLRRFFINQVSKELKKQNGEKDTDKEMSKMEKDMMKSKLSQVNPEAHRPAPISESRAPHQNNPEIRALQNKDRTNIPTRLIRFGGT